MSNINKMVLFFFLITAISASVFLAGCAESPLNSEIPNPTASQVTPTATTTPGASVTSAPSALTGTETTAQMDARQILKDAYQAVVSAKKYRIQEALSMNVMTSASLVSPKITASGEGAFDKIKNQSLLAIAMTVDMGRSLGKQTFNFSIFSMTDYIYVKMDSGSASIIPWVKTRPTAELIDSLNADMFENDLKSMDSPAEATLVTSENINGSDYYVITFVPGSDYLKESIGEQTGDSSGIEWAKIPDIRSLFKTLSYKVWIAKSTKYIYKMEYAASFALTKDLFINPKEATDVSADITGTLSFHDFNAEFSVNLPSEAQNAEEVSADDITI
jgi:hypothetical protein